MKYEIWSTEGSGLAAYTGEILSERVAFDLVGRWNAETSSPKLFVKLLQSELGLAGDAPVRKVDGHVARKDGTIPLEDSGPVSG